MDNYSLLGTSNDRKETVADHVQLQNIMDRDWEQIKNFCYLDKQTISDWQLKRIKQLVEHAYKTVPLYKEKYSAVGFEPEDFKTWKDFSNLPILTKDELIAGFPDKILSNKFDYSLTTRSTGSSGQFVTLAVDINAIYTDTVQGVRQFYFQSGGNYHLNDTVLFIYTSPWWVSSLNGNYKQEFISTTTKIQDAVEIIKKIKPKIISTYPTYLYQFYDSKISLKNLGVEYVVVHSEHSTPKERQQMSNFFKIPVLDEFSSEELTRIALECPYGNHHLEEDACYIEIISTDKELSNNQGLVVGTNLLNEATPIIRYSQGDIAEYSDLRKCPCGSNFRMIKPVLGRYMDSIVNDDGHIVPASSFMDLAYNWFLELKIPVHALRYQIVQQKNKNINIYLIEGKYKLNKKQIGLIRNSIYQLVSKKIKVDVFIVEDFPIKKGVKHRPVISLINK